MTSSSPSIADLRTVTQPESTLGRASAEHWAGPLYMRRVSPYVTRALLRTPITANGVTWLMIPSGLLGAAALTIPGLAGPLLAVLFIQLQFLFDCCDGEVARWRGESSAEGVYLDRIAHHLTDAALPIALGIRAAGGWDSLDGWVSLGLLVAVLVLLIKAETQLVTVARAESGLPKLRDTTASAAPRATRPAPGPPDAGLPALLPRLRAGRGLAAGAGRGDRRPGRRRPDRDPDPARRPPAGRRPDGPRAPRRRPLLGPAALMATRVEHEAEQHGRLLEDEFHAERHVYEPHKAGLPPMGSYLHELWRRRQFAYEMARTTLRAQNFNTALGQLWLLLNPLLLTCVYFLLIDILRDHSRGSVFFAHLMAGLFAYNFISTSLNQAGRSVTKGGRLVLNTAFPRTLLPLSAVLVVVPALPADAGDLRRHGDDRAPAVRPPPAVGDPGLRDHRDVHGRHGDAHRRRCTSTSATSRASCPTRCGSGSTPRRCSTTTPRSRSTSSTSSP